MHKISIDAVLECFWAISYQATTDQCSPNRLAHFELCQSQIHISFCQSLPKHRLKRLTWPVGLDLTSLRQFHSRLSVRFVSFRKMAPRANSSKKDTSFKWAKGWVDKTCLRLRHRLFTGYWSNETKYSQNISSSTFLKINTVYKILLPLSMWSTKSEGVYHACEKLDPHW